MMTGRTFVDSSAWIDFFNGRDTAVVSALHGLLGRQLLVTGDVVLVEVLQGFRTERDINVAHRLLHTLDIEPVLGHDLAVKCARNYRTLRSRGVTVRKTIDVIIATFCIERGYRLLHNDRDFKPFARHLGLQEIPA